MGFYPSADLIFGIPIEAAAGYDDDYNTIHHPLYDAHMYCEDPALCEAGDCNEEGDWKENLPGELEIRTYGHYDDPDGPRAVLTSSRFERYSGDAWSPGEINPIDLSVSDKAKSKTSEQLRQVVPDSNFYADAKWVLVASYG